MLVFLAGPYFAYEINGQHYDKQDNIWRAKFAAIQLWKHGIPTICPHLNTLDFEYEVPDDDLFVKGYLDMLECCTHVIALINWQHSIHTKVELRLANELKIPVYYGVAEFLRSLNNAPAVPA